MGGISYNVWLRGLCVGLSWFRRNHNPTICVQVIFGGCDLIYYVLVRFELVNLCSYDFG
jgi:hypothetical protein